MKTRMRNFRVRLLRQPNTIWRMKFCIRPSEFCNNTYTFTHQQTEKEMNTTNERLQRNVAHNHRVNNNTSHSQFRKYSYIRETVISHSWNDAYAMYEVDSLSFFILYICISFGTSFMNFLQQQQQLYLVIFYRCLWCAC